MEFLSSTVPSNFRILQTPTSPLLHRSNVYFPSLLERIPVSVSLCCAVRTGSNGGKLESEESYDYGLLQKPITPPPDGVNDELAKGFHREIERGEEDEEGGGNRPEVGKKWVDWEDQILEDTVPLVGLVRMVLHSGRYQCGDKLSPEHQKAILERVLIYHPEYEKKIGCGVDYITIGYHPEFTGTRCMFIVRTDGEMIDFSYWKCIKGLIRKNYPHYADSFILRHFRRRKRTK